MQQSALDEIESKNTEFWDEPCGTGAATVLGFDDKTLESFQQFDEWFFNFYPYVFKHIPFQDLKNKKVLEVGLGYGSVSQKLIESGANYQGLDIAKGPVDQLNLRMKLANLEGNVKQGSIINPPFEANQFDYVVAIGCYHHTGDVKEAIEQTYRLLVPGGKAMVMVYNVYSYRRWVFSFASTFRYWLKEIIGKETRHFFSDVERIACDANSKGEAAPETDFLSFKRVRSIARKFKKVKIVRENFQSIERFFGKRELYLNTVAPYVGLDLYIHLEK